MKVAILGTSIDLTENEERDIRQAIALTLKNYSTDDTIVISGGAKGVDSLAIEIAQGLQFKTEIYNPKKQNWTHFKRRNLHIAKDCDELYAISVPNRSSASKCYHHEPKGKHEKTAACWTMNEALKLNKVCKLIVIPNRYM